MVPTPDLLLSQFIDDWSAGRRPSVREYLRRVPEGPAREELADAIADWLDVAPTPPLGEEARAAIRAEPVVQRLFAAATDDAGLWPQLLPALRRRSQLSIGQLAGRLVTRFALSPADEPRTAAYLQQLEDGELEPTRVSRRLLDALADLLGAGADALADAGTFGRGLRPAAAGGTLFRVDDAVAEDWVFEDLEVLAAAAAAPAPAPLDEVDRLFLGGPEG
jgi:hypothetical protein